MSSSTAETQKASTTTTTTSTTSQQQHQEEFDEDYEDETHSTSSKSVRTPRQHPLENNWTLWFHNPSKKTNASNYVGFLNSVCKFKTVEEFWGVFNHVMVPSKLGIGCTYYVFKDDIRPEWESPECKDGGEWMLTLNVKDRKDMDEYWENIVLACIGENFDDEVSKEICGCCVAVRKAQLRISLWIGTSEERLVMKLGHQFRESVLLLDQYSDQDETQKKKLQSLKSLSFSFKSFKDQLNNVRDPTHIISG